MAADQAIREIKKLRWFEAPDYILLMEECRAEAAAEVLTIPPWQKVEWFIDMRTLINRAQELNGLGHKVALLKSNRCFIRIPSKKYQGIVTLELMEQMDRESGKTGLRFVDISDR